MRTPPVTPPVVRATVALAAVVGLATCSPAPQPLPQAEGTPPTTSRTPLPTLADPAGAAAALERDLHPAGASTLPGGRTDYRRPADVTADLELLASRRPDVVRTLALPHRTPLGTQVTGVELGRAD